MLIENLDYEEEDLPWGPGCLVGLALMPLPWLAMYAAWRILCY